MPSARRLRLLMVGVVAAVVMTLVYTSHVRQSQEADARTFGDFYRRTKNGLDRQHGQAALGRNDEEDAQLSKDMSVRLKAAEQKAKDAANAKVLRPDAPSKVVGVGSSAGGQKKKPVDEIGGRLKEQETKEDHDVETAINDILKKSPVIIFSKTYCPYSKRAKGLLLDKYSIKPEPYVVELDAHPLGQQIQDRLGQMTGRKTVPNIMVNAKSIGGSDEIAELENRHELVDRIRSLGSVGGKALEMKERLLAREQ